MLDNIKDYMKIDSSDEDLVITALITSAETYLQNAGIKKDYQNELYNQAIKLLVIHWYENREIFGSANKLAFSLENIITQLQYCYQVVEQ